MQNQFFDLYRQGIKTGTEITRASLEGAVRLQQQQLDVARNALEESGKSTNQFSEAKSMDELMSLQSRLTGAQMERITEYWANMWRASMDYHKTLIDQMQSQIGQAKDRVRESYSFTTRTTEEAARVAVSQVASSSASVREAAAQQERKAHEQQRKTV
jgi:hypothetical protein